MPASKRSLGLVALLAVAAPQTLPASESPFDRIASGAAGLVDHVRLLIHDVSHPRRPQQSVSRNHPPPQAIPSGGASVDLSDLSKPTLLESRLRSALQPVKGEVRITVPGGTARQGDFSLGSAENQNGHLLVVNGNADVYGHLNGNLV